MNLQSEDMGIEFMAIAAEAPPPHDPGAYLLVLLSQLLLGPWFYLRNYGLQEDASFQSLTLSWLHYPIHYILERSSRGARHTDLHQPALLAIGP